jgi:DNA polymerase
MLRIDLETRSDIDLLKRGVYVYAESPHADVLMAAYQIGDGEIRTWLRGEPCPDDLRASVEAGDQIAAFNSAFERVMWWRVLTPKYGWPKPRLEQFVCTAVTAAAMSLPRSLERLGAALDLAVQKDKKGKALIKRHSIPQGYDADGRPVWNDDQSSTLEFLDYCKTDVATEAAAARRLVPLSEHEQTVYSLSERVNDRGLRIDVLSARAAVALAEKAKVQINREMSLVTGGYVATVTQTAALRRWVASRGVDMPSLDKDDVEEFLFDYDDLPDDVRRALELRQEGAKPSVEKIAAMLDRVCADGRARGVYLHHGAGQTGRFSSRGLQAHNMPKYRKGFEAALGKGEVRLDVLFRTIRLGEPSAFEFMYGPELGRPLHLLSDAVRSFIWAAPGHDLLDADFSSIEGRMAAWFAGEDWKLDAFRALDRGEGHGIYELAAAGIYGISIGDVTKAHRPTGKVAELSCQYQTGVGGIKKFARQNKIKLPTLYPALWAAADGEQREFVEKRFADRVKAHDPNTDTLGREGWIAAELIKTGWRGKHPKIVAAWKTLEEAATAAVATPGFIATALGSVRYVAKRGFLWCMLPGGRCLAYGAPKMQETEAPWADKTLEPSKRERKLSLTVMGTDAQTEKWIRFPVYGGSLFNNVVQGSARDLLVNGMEKAEAANYPIVLHTHDELAAEIPRGFGDVGEFERLICELPEWAAGLPLTASGWRGKRYRKD